MGRDISGMALLFSLLQLTHLVLISHRLKRGLTFACCAAHQAINGTTAAQADLVIAFIVSFHRLTTMQSGN